MFGEVSAEEIIKTVNGLSTSRSQDIFYLSNWFIKQIIFVIVIPLTFMFNLCFEKQVFPECLKLSKIVPTYKRGDRKLLSSYRPISLVPIFSKILESLMYKQVLYFFYQHNIFSSKQFGFQKGKSTVKAMEYLVKSIIMAFEDKNYVSITLCDLTKAFDCISHELLLFKLEHYGIRGESLKLFKSYLNNRRQIVNIKNKNSDIISINNGVLQGSILGPFLFIVAINDLPFNLSIEPIIYADDTTLVACNSDLKQLNVFTIASQ